MRWQSPATSPAHKWPLTSAVIVGVLPDRPMRPQEPALVPTKALGRQLTIGRRPGGPAARREPGLGGADWVQVGEEVTATEVLTDAGQRRGL